jgi:hypothetical protein
MKNLSDYRGLFYREKRPYWVIFCEKGIGIRKAATPGDVMEVQDKKERLDDSWNALLESESDLSSGEYRLVLQTSENAGKGKIVRDFVVGTPSESSSVGKTDRISAQGVGGLNGIGGLQFITGLMGANQSEVNRYRDTIQDLKIELVEKKNEIERLKDAKKVKKEDETIGSLIKSVVKDHFPKILDKISPSFAPSVAIASVESPNGEVDAADAGSKLDFQKRFQAIFADIEVLFPNENPLDVMETVLELAKESALVVGMVKEALAKKRKK